jgi:hypothetical protein
MARRSEVRKGTLGDGKVMSGGGRARGERKKVFSGCDKRANIRPNDVNARETSGVLIRM